MKEFLINLINRFSNVLFKNSDIDSLNRKLDQITNEVLSLRNEFSLNQKSNIHSPLYDYYYNLRNLLKTYDILGFAKVRIGRNGDGGYVMLDDFSNVYNAYSIGISNEISWDYDISKKNIDIFMYDHTIDSLPYENSKFHFNKQGISNIISKDMTTLESAISLNNHNNEDLILKIDIEGYEWRVFTDISVTNINKFKHIVIELHDLDDFREKDTIINVLKKLNQTHYLIHIHANNNTSYSSHNGLIVPRTLEVSYIRKDNYKAILNSEFYPTNLDYKNYAQNPEINLGIWNKF